MCYTRNMASKNEEQEHPESSWQRSDLCKCGHHKRVHGILKRVSDGNAMPVMHRKVMIDGKPVDVLLCSECSCQNLELAEQD
ncbi:MAG: hypothetical protein Q8Q91_00640 [Candidatus Daviesbacteria bacterium]|nr:hypothetical protein [Candidatus Daviesbacteria bacterium]